VTDGVSTCRNATQRNQPEANHGRSDESSTRIFAVLPADQQAKLRAITTPEQIVVSSVEQWWDDHLPASAARSMAWA